ncbi:hypothetical protein D3H64_08470 [Atopobacter sp. AH10]|nr:hypothetical protein D3H64_08470 [Atopobacter sp. AH10]
MSVFASLDKDKLTTLSVFASLYKVKFRTLSVKRTYKKEARDFTRSRVFLLSDQKLIGMKKAKMLMADEIKG